MCERMILQFRFVKLGEEAVIRNRLIPISSQRKLGTERSTMQTSLTFSFLSEFYNVVYRADETAEM